MERGRDLESLYGRHPSIFIKNIKKALSCGFPGGVFFGVFIAGFCNRRKSLFIGEQGKDLLRQQFSFDSFRWQQEQGLRIREPFRADGLNRVLYKCPHCLTEGQMTGKGTLLTCGCCGRQYELTELGALRATNGEAAFTHVPDWFRWERECVRCELTEGRYALELPVDICMLVDMRSI